MSDKEIIDIVSENDSVIGHACRKEIYAKKLFFRVVNGLIINKDRKIWIPRRSSSKKMFPSYLDCSIGGHVKTNEQYFEAFVRESIEETNIDPRNHPFQFLKKLTPKEDQVSAFMHLFVIYNDKDIAFNSDDFEEYYWLSSKEIVEKIEKGEKAKGDLLKIIKEFQKHEDTVYHNFIR